YKQETEIPPEGTDAVEYFLFKLREGDCVNFASTMTVMLRSIGVPARFSTGYLMGTLDRNSGKYIVRARDYHARPEVYFPGYGWIEFEATTRLRAEEDITFAGSGTSPPLEDEDEDFFSGGGGGAFEGTSPVEQPGQTTPFPTTFFLIPLLFIVGIVLYRWLRRFTGTGQASDVYAKMCFLASLINRGPNPQETPLEYSIRLSSALPLQAESINNIAQAYTESRYSPRKRLFLPQEMRLERYWRDVYRALFKQMLRWRR
ncbi:MAG: transglutaminase domain-containing protein, partial [Dehalococcoidales bacterium]|nr:transglutaminase domain-containing protein [Dehalococcoidales bacterium]